MVTPEQIRAIAREVIQHVEGANKRDTEEQTATGKSVPEHIKKARLEQEVTLKIKELVSAATGESEREPIGEGASSGSAGSTVSSASQTSTTPPTHRAR